MIEVIQGKGAFVRNRSQKAIEAHLQFLINFETKAREELMELRHLLEVGLVRLAAERADEEDLVVMRRWLDEMALASTLEHQVEAGAAFHLAVAKAAKNAFITSIYEPVTQVIGQVYSALERSEHQMRQSIADHEEIYLAIAGHQPDVAVEKTLAHLTYLDHTFGPHSGQS